MSVIKRRKKEKEHKDKEHGLAQGSRRALERRRLQGTNTAMFRATNELCKTDEEK